MRLLRTVQVAVLLLLTGALATPSAAGARPERTQQRQQKDDQDDKLPANQALEQKACGPKDAKYSADTDKKQHPTPDAPADMALVYVVRPTMVGNKIQTKLGVDGTWLSVNRGNNYFYFTLAPGAHDFCSQAENRSVLSVTVEAGKTYYVQQKIRMGLMKARNELELLDEAEGKKGLAKTNLSISEEKK